MGLLVSYIFIIKTYISLFNMEKAALRIGWIGTGVMGKSMVGHLMKQGYQLSIYTRTKAKAEELIQLGASY